MKEDAALVAVSKGKSVPAALELLEEVLTELEKRVDKKIYSTINGPVAQVDVVQMITEKATYEKVRKALRNKERAGRAASEALKPMMEGKSDG